VSLEKGQETLRLRVYACYAWGGPLLVAGLAALLDHLPSEPQYTFLRPRFGEKQCWFYGKLVVSELSGEDADSHRPSVFQGDSGNARLRGAERE